MHTALPSHGPSIPGRRAVEQAAPKVRVCDMSKEFTFLGRPLRALDRINFSVADGEIVVVAGQSGCGKSTLLRIVLGLETVTSGWVEVSGRRVECPGQDRGMVFQQPQLLPWRSVLENATLGLEAQRLTPQGRRERAERYLELVGLTDYRRYRPMQLSGGMQQRVGLARALAIEPEVLLMDEPFSALDAQTRENLQESLLKIHEQTRKTILFVTHDLDEAVLLADRVVIMWPAPGRVREIVEIKIPRPRRDVIGIRGSEEYLQKRYYIWRSLKMYSAGLAARTEPPGPAPAAGAGTEA